MGLLMVMLVTMVETCADLRISAWLDGIVSALAAAVIWFASGHRLRDAGNLSLRQAGPPTAGVFGGGF